MRARLSPIILVAAAFGSLAGCSDFHHQERPPWRAQAEEACLAKGLVRETSSVRPFHQLDGPGICGATHPFKVTALNDGSVALNATETLDCPMIAALDGWIRDVVQPAAEARFGERVVRVNSMGSYSCRGINNMSGANLSEHSFANAIDIGGFVLASGRELNVRKGFNGADEQERAFLHEAHAGACTSFTTVLGPGYNIFHYNHFHMDLALHGSTSRGPRRYCKPVPQTNLPEPPVKDALPDPPAIEEEMDIARAPLPEPAYRSGPPRLLASAPPPLPVPAHAGAYTPRPILAADDMAPAHAAVRARPTEAPLISFGETGGEEAATPVRKPRVVATGFAPLPEDASPAPFASTSHRRQASRMMPAAAATDEADPQAMSAPAAEMSPPAEISARDQDLTSSVKR
jgi:hypothetical protein